MEESKGSSTLQKPQPQGQPANFELLEQSANVYDTCGLDQLEFNAITKVVLLGAKTTGKTTLMENLVHADFAAAHKKKRRTIKKDKHLSSTIQFYLINLRETQERVILIDVPGLDDSESSIQASHLILELSGIQNINLALVFVKYQELMSVRLKRFILEYQQMLISQGRQAIFACALTGYHCNLVIDEE